MSRYTEKELREFVRNGGKFLGQGELLDTVCILAREVQELEKGLALEAKNTAIWVRRYQKLSKEYRELKEENAKLKSAIQEAIDAYNEELYDKDKKERGITILMEALK